MFPTNSVLDLVHSFNAPEDGAATKSRELVLMLLDCTASPFSRDQFTPGHITCTGLVLHPAGDRVLLVHHRRLDRWLLPGGHVEPEDATIADAARREVVEETGARLHPDPNPPLASIDVHGIPGKGREPYHLHHDLIFHFRAAHDSIEVSPESRAVLWCPLAEFERYAVPANVQRALARLAAR
jgi:8-oxo-dGTP pyrophosphatase MutT (NUDIX family)